jgi:hypothetical protein
MAAVRFFSILLFFSDEPGSEAEAAEGREGEVGETPPRCIREASLRSCGKTIKHDCCDILLELHGKQRWSSNATREEENIAAGLVNRERSVLPLHRVLLFQLAKVVIELPCLESTYKLGISIFLTSLLPVPDEEDNGTLLC